jgi:hypothetical protein
MYELNPLTGIEIIDGIKFTPVRTVGGSSKGLTHHGYIDPRDRQYKVCRIDEAAEIASAIAATELPAVAPVTVEIYATQA